MARRNLCESACPVDRTLSLIGDRWTLLILRELSLGVHRFDGIQAQTGMSSHLLADRLRALESHRLVERRLYQARPKRFEYHATERGLELDPLLMMLSAFGLRWRGDAGKSEPAVMLRHKATGKIITRLSQYPGVVEEFRFSELDGTIGAKFQAERDAKLQSFRAAKAGVAGKRRKPKAPAHKKAPLVRG